MDIPVAGAKAARLGHLSSAGFPVPDGFVLLINVAGREEDARVAVRAGLAAIGGGRVAVRSSGTSEDLAAASFAGQYESVLDVEGEDAVMDAVRRCWDSAGSERVIAYAAGQTGAQLGQMAVLIQRMVDADAAGVAYSANPLTGDSAEVVISAVRGLGERLVGGEANAADDAIDSSQETLVAALARDVERSLNAPQDIEWALGGGTLHLLQARPMTGLPDQVTWVSPIPRGFARHFRFGEWLGDPVTPLFESWLLSLMEERLHSRYKAMMGLPMPRPFHVVLNGWYFYGLPPIPEKPADVLRVLPRLLAKLVVQPRRVAMAVPPLAHLGIELALREWRETALPSLLRTVQDAESRVQGASTRELVELIDAVARETGDYFTYVTLVAGYAAKAELPLGKFYKEHIGPSTGGSPLELLQGLVEDIGLQPHAVLSLDWHFPTLGELSAVAPARNPKRRADLEAARRNAEERSRRALTRQPKLARRFDQLLATAQRFQPVREECVSHLTRGWPVMRVALDRLAEDLRQRGVIDGAADIHFLRHDEVMSALSGAHETFDVSGRRETWEGQRRLSPPLVVGRVAPMTQRILDDFSDSTRSPSSAAGIQGVAASPGRASGPARIIRDQSEFDQLQPGDILVASATTPVWTMLFARAAGVVTDTGSIGSHASQVAREYGIPAVVCTGDATRRLKSGQVVTVDGSAGVVEVS
ncbi:PEP/pyruvate-binding domain-containing protein [Pseudarthrobacter sp. N5]|uniref:PEP/pyruvate-binding domain-containing protein n=1 Tax=Pseudarthrobacter sp. N5 TaxID=3418416 RepID=UPI003CEE4570